MNQMEMHVLAEDINHPRIRCVSLWCDSLVEYMLSIHTGITLPNLPKITYLNLLCFMVTMFLF